MPLVEEALAMLREVDCGHLEVDALRALVSVHVARGMPKYAIQAAAEGAERFRKQDQLRGEADIMRTLAELHSDNAKEALRARERCRMLLKRLGKKREEVEMLLQIAQLHLDDGRQDGQPLSKSLKDAQWTAEGARRIGGKLPEKAVANHLAGTAMGIVAQVHLLNWLPQESLEAAKESASLFRACEDPQGEAGAELAMADVHIFLEDFDAAAAAITRSSWVSEACEDEDGQAQAQWYFEHVQGLCQDAGRELQMLALPSDGALPAEASRASAAPAVDRSLMVRSEIAKVIDKILMVDDLSGDMPLMMAGLTSQSAVLMQRDLAQALPGVRLPTTLIFDYPTLNGMSEYIVTKYPS